MNKNLKRTAINAGSGAVIYAVILLLVFVGCKPKTQQLYEMPAINPVAEVTFHEFKTRKELEAVIGSHRLGKAVWSPQDNKCDVYFLAGDFATLGHEVYHCYKGSFHEE